MLFLEKQVYTVRRTLLSSDLLFFPGLFCIVLSCDKRSVTSVAQSCKANCAGTVQIFKRRLTEHNTILHVHPVKI